METNRNNQSTSYHTQHAGTPTGAAKAGLTMASAALIFGAGALLTLLTVFLPLVLGSLAIVLALLSKGSEKKMLTQAKVGFGCGIAGLSMVLALLGSTYALMFTHPEMLPEAGRMVDTMYEETYDTKTEDILGFSYEDLMTQQAEKITSLKERRLP
ncbi:MAG: hypothetical protein IKY23_09855 [Lachnospiraceae bacterium]|nr:hypothetical protein [Lachnospiraceae bacterium]